MKLLPLGLQDFEKVSRGNYVYVDKTEHIHRMISQGSYYFLSRPRRFGKSLLVNTLKEIFSGKKELFKDLWIYDKIEWIEYPVVKISFNEVAYKKLGLEDALNYQLNEIASEFGIELPTIDNGLNFKHLIRELAVKQKVVILIDEYDKPIIDYIDNEEQATENRDILKNFYSVLKDSDANIRFLFITGVSKFSKVSIFSDLNNLNDITIHEDYAELTGITHNELTSYFSDYITIVQQKLQKYYPDIIQSIKDEYYGYSWNGNNFVYNPFTLLNFFDKKNFGDYWFQSGTPTFLFKLIKKEKYTAYEIENKSIFVSAFDKFDINNISLISLLFQTGYLTIKKFDYLRNSVTLGFPNKEVERSFSIHFIAEMNGGKTDMTNSILYDLTDHLAENRIEKFMEVLKSLFKGIAYPLIDNKEKYFHSIFYVIVKMLGFNIETEIMTIDGRIDCVVKTEKIIYVIEFKTGNTKKAIDQLHQKQYHTKYLTDKKPIQLFGIDFDAEKKEVRDWVLEDV